MVTANIQIFGINKLKSWTKNTRLKLERRSVANHKAVIVLDKWIQKNFQAEGGSLESKWESLAESTIKRRRTGPRKGKGHRILQDTGDLKTNWKHYWTHKIGMVRSKTPYAIYHDSDQPRHRLPRRQILPDEKHVMPEILKIFDSFVRSTLR